MTSYSVFTLSSLISPFRLISFPPAPSHAVLHLSSLEKVVRSFFPYHMTASHSLDIHFDGKIFPSPKSECDSPAIIMGAFLMPAGSGLLLYVSKLNHKSWPRVGNALFAVDTIATTLRCADITSMNPLSLIIKPLLPLALCLPQLLRMPQAQDQLLLCLRRSFSPDRDI